MRTRTKSLIATALLAALALVVPVVAVAPVGADVIRVDPVYDASTTNVPSWAPTLLTASGYAIGYPFLVGGGSYIAWGPDIATVQISDLILPAGSPGAPSFQAINDRGVAAGTYTLLHTGEAASAFVVDLHDRVVVTLDISSSDRSEVSRVSLDGTIVGARWIDGVDPPHGAAWLGPDHHLVDVPDLGYGSWLTDVNDHGLAGGWMLDAAGKRHPATWDLVSGSPPVDLAPITGVLAVGRRVTVNQAGDVLVQLGTDYCDCGHDVVVEHGTNRLVPLYDPDTAYGAILNNRAEVAFLSYHGANHTDPAFVVLDLTTGSRQDIPALPHVGGSAFFFNDRGQIATTRQEAGTAGSGVIWDPVRGWIDLGDAGGRGIVVSAMNGTGRVGGYYGDTNTAWFATVQLGPEAPRDPAADVVSGTVALRWVVPVSPGNAPIDAYRVYRDGTLIDAVAPTRTAFTDSDLADPGRTAAYTVTAINTFGESAPSPAVLVAEPELASTAMPAGATPAAIATAIPTTPAYTG